MGISVMSLLPQFAAKPAANANGTAAASPDQGFNGVLALLAGVTAPKPGAAANPHPSPLPEGEGTRNSELGTRNSLQQVLQALTNGKLDLTAPGLGLSAAQREQLLTNLEKLLKDAEHDGEQLLASLLAASQPATAAAGQGQPLDLSSLLGASGQDTASINALASNVQLLVQALQVVSNSDGKLTLLQAVQELAPPGDPFADQLAKAIQGDSEPSTQDSALAIDTGPPRASDQASGQTSATAGSDGRELTAGTQPASPTDGAVQEASQSQSQTQSPGAEPEVLALAQVLESLIQAQPQKPSTGAALSSPSPAGTPPSPSPAAAGEDPTDVVLEFAQMLSASTTSPAARVPTQPRSTVRPIAGTAMEQAGGQPADVLAKTIVTTPDPGTPSQDGGGHQLPQGAAQTTPVTATHDGPAPTDSSSPFAALAAGVSMDSGVRPADAAAAAAPPRAAVEQAVVEQIVQHATLALRNGEQEFRIQLKPEFLGAMEVRVSVSDGTALVRMTAENAATRQLIDANIGQLRQAFGTGDVRIEHVPTFAGANASWSSLTQGGQQGASGGWQGQNPYDGSARLPEAIAFSGEAEPEPVAAAAAQSSSFITHPSSTAVDIKA